MSDISKFTSHVGSGEKEVEHVAKPGEGDADQHKFTAEDVDCDYKIVPKILVVGDKPGEKSENNQD